MLLAGTGSHLTFIWLKINMTIHRMYFANKNTKLREASGLAQLLQLSLRGAISPLLTAEELLAGHHAAQLPAALTPTYGLASKFGQ